MNDIGQHPLGKNIATLLSSYRVVSNYLADTDSSSQPWFPEHGQGAFSVTLSHVGCSSAAAVQEASTGLAAGFPWCLDGFCSKHRLLERSKMNGGVFHCFLSSYSDCCSGSHNSFPSRGSWATFSSKRYLKKKREKKGKPRLGPLAFTSTNPTEGSRHVWQLLSSWQLRKLGQKKSPLTSAISLFQIPIFRFTYLFKL